MSTNFYLKSIQFENYRGLSGLSLGKLKRVNLIGGYNGSGKSTFLEAIFTILDRRNPMSIVHPINWRRIPLGGPSTILQMFADLDNSKTIKIACSTQDGATEMAMKYGPRAPGVTVEIPSKQPQEAVQNSMSSDSGLTVEISVNNNIENSFFALPLPNGIQVTVLKSGATKIPQGAIVTAMTRNNAQEDAQRYSDVVKAGKTKQLLSIISVVRADVIGVQLLQDGPGSILYAQLNDGKLLPFGMLGDGLQTVVSIALLILNIPGGVVLLDEFEASIHYSILPLVWEKIFVLAKANNCQVFAVTHSLECVKAAVEAAQTAGSLADLQYIRFERERTGQNLAAVTYDSDELSRSLESGWEIR